MFLNFLCSRMEDAILRFQKSRRIDNHRAEIFTKYLAYGGIDMSAKMFPGVDRHDMEEVDKEDILIAKGELQSNSAQERSKLAIDFNLVVKGYL